MPEPKKPKEAQQVAAVQVTTINEPRAGNEVASEMKMLTDRSARRRDVEHLLLHGARPERIIEIVTERHGVSRRSVERDIAFVRSEFEKAGAGSREQNRKLAMRRVGNLANRAKASGDDRLVLAAEMQLAKLGGYDNGPSETDAGAEGLKEERLKNALYRAYKAMSPARVRAYSLAGQLRSAHAAQASNVAAAQEE